MDKDAIVKELNGQTLKVLDLYTKKDQALKMVEQGKKQLAELEPQIKELNGIIQTLQFMIQTDGFSNVELASPPQGKPFKLSDHIKQGDD